MPTSHACPGLRLRVATGIATGNGGGPNQLAAIAAAARNAAENAERDALTALADHECEAPCERWYRHRTDFGRTDEPQPDGLGGFTVKYYMKWWLDIDCRRRADLYVARRSKQRKARQVGKARTRRSPRSRRG